MPVLSYCSHSLFLSGMFLHHSFFSIPVSVCLPHSAAAATCSHPDLQVHTHAQLRLSHYTHCGDVAAGWFVSWEKRRYLSWSASCLWSCTTSQQYLHLLRIVLIYIYIYFFTEYNTMFSETAAWLNLSLLYIHPRFLCHLCAWFYFSSLLSLGRAAQTFCAVCFQLWNHCLWECQTCSPSLCLWDISMCFMFVWLRNASKAMKKKREQEVVSFGRSVILFTLGRRVVKQAPPYDLTSLRGIRYFFLSDFHPFLRSALSKIVFCKNCWNAMNVYGKTRTIWVL